MHSGPIASAAPPPRIPKVADTMLAANPTVLGTRNGLPDPTLPPANDGPNGIDDTRP